MSKKLMLAKDLLPGDTIRLVYEIVVDEIGDLDAKFPSESDNMFFIKGMVIKGPLHRRGTGTEFAIYGDDKVTFVSRKSWFAKVKEHLSSYRSEKPKKSPTKKLHGSYHPFGVT